MADKATMRILRSALLMAVLAAAGACAGNQDPKATAPGVNAAAVDAHNYCVTQLGAMAQRYPKSLGGSDLSAECSKMIGQTGATSVAAVDGLLRTAEGYYKAVG